MGRQDGQLEMTAAELAAYLDEVFPQIEGMMRIETLEPYRALLRMPVADRHLRPGGTVSGPTLFTLADCAFYVATLSMIGRQALTVTTNVSINFMRKPTTADLLCEARILKLGRTLSVGDATIFSEGSPEPVAHASLTYSIPPAKIA